MPQQPVDPHQLIDQVTENSGFSEEVVPWFIEQMPLMYFQDTSPEDQLVHLRAIIAARASGRPIELTLRSEDGSECTSMRPLDYPGVLAELVSELPEDQPLRTAKIHTASDGSLVIDTFEFGETPRFDADDPAQREKLESTLQYAAEHLPEWDPEEVRDYFHRCNGDYVLTLTPLRMCSHWRLFQEVTGTDGTAVALEKEKADVNLSRIVVAASNASRRSMLERVAQLLSCSSINIHRAYLDTVDDGENGSTSILGFVVQNKDGHAIDPAGDAWDNGRRELRRIKWVDAAAIDLDRRHPQLDLTSAELIIALCSLSHQVLVKRNPYAVTMDRIRRLAESNIEITTTITDLMQQRFNPAHPFRTATSGPRCGDERASTTRRTCRTHGRSSTTCSTPWPRRQDEPLPRGRYALSMHIDPQFMDTDQQPAPSACSSCTAAASTVTSVPRHRTRRRAGGGDPRPGPVQRRDRATYDEAYGLAFAQQMKNKDIPEGGSKAAVLLHPRCKVDRMTKAFVDSILDLITRHQEPGRRSARPRGTALLNENVTPRLVDWIVGRADTGYGCPPP